MAGIERANGHRPHGVLDVMHPALKNAPRPDRDSLPYDLDLALDAVFKLHAEVPPSAFTAQTLGTEREGSAVLIGEDGLLLTIGYLITEATRVTLVRRDGEAFEAHPIAYDHESGFGMVRTTERLGSPPLLIGDSSSVAEADHVVVASFGGISHALSAQVVSIQEFAGAWEYMIDDAIYTVPMHPYWGGAALIDGEGRLVGTGSLYVEHAALSGDTVPGNMFVPIDLLRPIRDAMVRTGRADRPPRPWLGMHSAEIGERLVVTGVSSGGPAELAGVEPGDVVLSVQGVPVEGLSHYYRTLWAAGAPETEIRLTLLRDDDVLTIRVTSGDRYSFLKLPRRH